LKPHSLVSEVGLKTGDHLSPEIKPTRKPENHEAIATDLFIVLLRNHWPFI
jgi:hypothetical protein